MISNSIFFVVTYWISCVQCLSNESLLYQDIPEIREGEPCVKGQMYKMSCNTCHCAENNALYCTKMACLNDESIHLLKHFKNSPLKTLRQGSEDNGPYLPELPRGLCVPGKLYREGCRKCFCNNKGRSVCSLQKRSECKEIPKITDVSTPNDVSPPITDDDYSGLPRLPHSAAKCERGKIYMVDCNSCLCLNSGNLICESKLCPVEEDKMWSGSKVKKLHGPSKKRPILDVYKDKCEPGTMYKFDCNYCSCQADGSLRCTQKTCLSYRQALKLKKLSSYLEKHGL